MKKTKINKKGIMLSEAFTAVLTVVLVAILVIVSLVIFSSLQTATLTANTAGSAINETVTPTDTGVSLSAASLTNGECGTIYDVINGSGTLITSSNYTQSGCTLTNTTNRFPTSWKVSYPYTWSAPSAASNATDVTITNFSQYPALIGLVGTIIFLALVIGVLVASFVFGGKKSA